MNNTEHTILILFILLLGCGIVEAFPPLTTVFAGNTGIHIEVNAMESYKLGEARWQVIQLFNESTGEQLTNDTINITCIIKLRNSQGVEIAERNATVHTGHWDINGSAGVNNPLGNYAWTIVCQDDDSDIGGYVSGYFEITTSGDIEPIYDSTSSIAIVLFILAITLTLFIIPFFKKFSSFEITNLILKRSCWVIAAYLMVLNSAILATISSTTGAGLNNEMFRYMWFFGIAGYLAMVFLFVSTLFNVLKLYRIKKDNERLEK